VSAPGALGDDVDAFARLAPTRAAGPIGAHVLALARTASTNDDARALAARGAPHGTLVVADTQDAGRGRLGRAWASPPGAGLYASLLLVPERPRAEWPLASLVAGIAVVDAVRRLVPARDAAARVGLKWPNDTLVERPGGARAKLSGVLAETCAYGGGRGGEALIVGIGVNITAAPPDLGARATALASLLAEPPHADPRRALLDALVDALAAALALWDTAGAAGVVAAWNARALGIGEPVRLVGGDGVIAGRLVGVDARGALLVDDAAGTRHVAWAGDLELPGYASPSAR
jgi:BirA family biotin operon repressor/biotin-[acetyl-CoA-carboxylase] ligase